jgi:hypothetical protein
MFRVERPKPGKSGAKTGLDDLKCVKSGFNSIALGAALML